MNTSRTIWICLALAIGIANHASADEEKENRPRNSKIVVEMLTEAGPEHMPEKMKPSHLASLQKGDTYYHIYTATPKKMNPRVIIFDNHDKYLGYYECEYEATDYEVGAILFESEEEDDDGEPIFYVLSIPVKGPKKTVNLDDGTLLTFVEPAEKTDAPVAMKTASGETIVPEYREWNITRKRTLITIRAIFVRKEPGKVIIRDEKRGREAAIAIHELSDEDKEYVEQFKK